jgi:Undecaprenyl-phosphate galactose phosphotransferase WbaP
MGLAAAPRRRLATTEGRWRTANVGIALLAADLFAVLIAATAAVTFRYLAGGEFDLLSYLKLSPLCVLFVAIFAMSGLYPGIALSPVFELQAVSKSATLGYMFLSAASFFQRDVESYSRFAVALAWLLTIPLVLLTRYSVRKVLSRRQWWGAPAVIFSRRRASAELISRVAGHPEIGLKVIGVLTASEDFGEPYGLGSFEDGPMIADECGVRYAILALQELPSAALSDILEKYASRFRNVIIVPELPAISALGVTARDLGGALGLEVNNRLLYPIPQMTKRMFDIVISGLGLLGLLPLFTALWFLIRVTSSGPAFYSQQRVGGNGTTIRIWKFRTMVQNACEVLEHHLQNNPEHRAEWESGQKLRSDPRVTSMGRFLRKTSMDELPQLWNVFRGNMSLVGPRPISNEEIPKYNEKYALYRRVKPGLTGLWQVSGRNNTTYRERVAFDEFYVRNWSIWLDMYILARTVGVVIRGDGAY